MTPRSRRVLAAAAGLACSAGALAWLVATVDLDRVGSRIAAADPGWLLAAIAILVIQAAVRSVRWAGLVTDAAGRAVQARRVAEPMLVGYLGNAVLPGRLGEVARAVLVARREAVPIGAAAASVVVERAVDLLALVALAAGALAAAGNPTSVALAASAIALAAVLLVARRADAVARRIPRRAPPPIADAVRHALTAAARVSRQRLAVAAGLSAVAWLGDAAVVWIVGQSLGLTVSPVAAVAIALGAAVGTAVPAAPGYLATYELGAVAFGSMAGSAPDVALSIALVTHLVGVLGLAAAGAIALARMSASGVRLTSATRGSLLELAGED